MRRLRVGGRAKIRKKHYTKKMTHSKGDHGRNPEKTVVVVQPCCNAWGAAAIKASSPGALCSF